MEDENTAPDVSGVSRHPLQQISLGPPLNSQTTKVPSRLMKSAIADHSEATQQQISAQQAEEAAQLQSAQQGANAFQAANAANPDFIAKRQAAEDAANARIQLKREAADRINDMVAQTVEHPRGFWDDKTTAQKVMSRIGVWVSALGAGISGGDNKALQYIDAQVKQDAAQKEARAQKLFKLSENSEGALSDAYRQRAEELSNIDANMAAGYNWAAKQAEAYARMGMPAEIKAKAAAAVGQLREKEAVFKEQAGAKLITTNVTEVPSAASQPQPIYDPNGNIVGLAPAHAAQKLQDDVQVQHEYITALDELIDLRNQSHAWDRVGLPTEMSHKLEQAYGRVKAIAPRALGLPPRMSKEQRELIEEIVPAGGPFITEVDELKKARDNAKEKAASMFNIVGGQGTAPTLGGQGRPAHAAKTAAPAQTGTAGGGLAARYQKAQAALSADPKNAQARKEMESLRALVGGR